MKRFCPTLCLLALPLLITGCNTITNLTPRQHVRNANGLYAFEVKWDSRQQSLRPESLRPSVIIGTETYPMQPVPLVKNRWETLVPIAPDQKLVNYRFKFDWEYNAIPKPRQDTKLSAPYQLQIIDK
jgi:hypothetical protein